MHKLFVSYKKWKWLRHLEHLSDTFVRSMLLLNNAQLGVAYFFATLRVQILADYGILRI